MTNEEKKKSNPLSRIVVEGDSLDLELLAETLAPYARIYRSGNVVDIGFTDEGEKLTNIKKLVVYLLARKALVHLDDPPIREEEQGLTPSELEDLTGIKGNTIRPLLRQLLSDRMLSNDEQFGGYYVPNYALSKINTLLNS